MDKRILYGGGALAVGVIAFIMLRGGGSSSAPADTTSGGYFPPIVYGQGSGSVATDNSGASTDDSISQMLAYQMQKAQSDASLTLAQIASDKELTLAGYANDLATTKLKTGAAIEQSLASQLSGIVASMVSTVGASSKSSSGFLGIGGGSKSTGASQTGLKSVSGTIGFDQDTGTISLDLAKDVSGQLPVTNPVTHVVTPAAAPFVRQSTR